MSPAVTRLDITCVVPAMRLSNAVAEAVVWATPTFDVKAEEGSDKLDVKDENASEDVARRDVDVEAGVSTPCSTRDWVTVVASEADGVCQWIDAALVVEGHSIVVFLVCVCKPCPMPSETAGDAAILLLLSEDVIGATVVGASLLLDVKCAVECLGPGNACDEVTCAGISPPETACVDWLAVSWNTVVPSDSRVSVETTICN